jgi:hypothetical protein
MLTNADMQKIKGLLTNGLNPINKQLTRIEKKINTSFDFLDRARIDHEKRLERVEKHLNLPSVS